MQQRYYDPGIGMFLSVDPVTAYSNSVGQFHRYRYANNKPTSSLTQTVGKHFRRTSPVSLARRCRSKHQLQAPLAYDETPVEDHRRPPRLPDNDRKWFSFGATWEMSDALEFSAAHARLDVGEPAVDVHSSSGS